ncbi:MAG TPA: tetratricopeptide repeat protein [Drouetiella sp.]
MSFDNCYGGAHNRNALEFDKPAFQFDQLCGTGTIKELPALNLKKSNGEPGVLDFSVDKTLYLCADNKGDDKGTQLFRAGYKAMNEERYKDAEKSFKELLKVDQQQYGKDSKEVASTYQFLGQACEKDKRYDAAKTYYKEGADISAKAKSEDPFNTGIYLHNVAKMDVQLKDWKAAAKSYEATIKILDSNAVHPASENARMMETTKALTDYADVINKLGRNDDAKKALERKDQIEKQYYHPDK